MKNNLSQLMESRFSELAYKNGIYQIERSGWSSRETQKTRFKVFFDMMPPNSSVLDVGCGTGDFYEYLIKHNFRGSYFGIDLIKANCLAAKKRFGVNSFKVADIQSYFSAHRFDFVFASGIFFLNAKDWRDAVKQSFDKMYSLCDKGMAANFLSFSSTEKKESLHYAVPMDILELASTYSCKYTLRHDYSKKNNDFTVAIYKN